MAHADLSFCPAFQRAVELVGRRWNGAIARALLPGPLRFSELARALPGISDRALSQRLKELEAEDVVERRVEPESPIRVAYGLTAKGSELAAVVQAVEVWAHAWLEPEVSPEHRSPR